MKYVSKEGAVIESNSPAGDSFVAAFIQAEHEHAVTKAEWIREVKAQGVMAAHPDDGWVNREENYVQFCYPHFNQGVTVGARIALGWTDKWRVVRVTSIKQSFFGMSKYFFMPDDPNS